MKKAPNSNDLMSGMNNITAILMLEHVSFYKGVFFIIAVFNEVGRFHPFIGHEGP